MTAPKPVAKRRPRRATAVQHELERRRLTGAALANCAYNLSQTTALDESTRRTLKALQVEWDAIPYGRRKPAPRSKR